MKTSNKWNYRFIVGKTMLVLVFAAMIGNVNVAPARGKDNHNHKQEQNHDNDHYEQKGHAYGHYEQKGHTYDRNRYYYDRNGRRVYHSYGHREQVYVAPPVVYAPPSPPGIGIFFPPIIIHP